MNCTDGPAKIKTTRLGGFHVDIKAPNGWARVPMAQRAIKTKFLWARAHTGTHDQYADEQLANPQKRICLIEFLHLGLVIVYQGAMGCQNKQIGFYPIFLCFPILSAVRKSGAKTTAVSPIYELFFQYLFQDIFVMPFAIYKGGIV